MNETSPTSQPGTSLLPDGIGAITTIHLALMAIVAIAAIAIILVGMRRKRARTHAERQVKINARDAGVPTIEEAARDAPEPEPAPVATPVPATPPPPPPPPPPVIVPEPEPVPAEPTPLHDEPIAAAAPLDASPATIATPDPVPVEVEVVPAEVVRIDPVPAAPAPAVPATPATDPADTPVTQLKGLGPKLATRLASLGITTVGQLVALSPAEAESLDAQLGPFTGRMARDRWIEQARLLAAGDRAGFEAVFGRL